LCFVSRRYRKESCRCLCRFRAPLSLGIKQLSQDPWTDITSKYPVGSKHSGIVRNFTNFGIFVELEEGIDGLIYISDLGQRKSNTIRICKCWRN
jgi:small subunit ribosomal protein S1